MDGETPFTYKKVAVEALLRPTKPNDKAPEPQKMIEHYDLAMRVQRAEEPLEITLDEAKEIKDLAAKNFPPLIFGQLHYFLEKTNTDKMEVKQKK